jgi:threonylcarbamoyladenosine tRNA methylthiotransferase MtaB
MKYIIATFGCKVNQYETQGMEAMLRERGHSAAETAEEADAVIVNSCAVTAESTRKGPAGHYAACAAAETRGPSWPSAAAFPR